MRFCEVAPPGASCSVAQAVTQAVPPANHVEAPQKDPSSPPRDRGARPSKLPSYANASSGPSEAPQRRRSGAEDSVGETSHIGRASRKRGSEDVKRVVELYDRRERRSPLLYARSTAVRTSNVRTSKPEVLRCSLRHPYRKHVWCVQPEALRDHESIARLARAAVATRALRQLSSCVSSPQRDIAQPHRQSGSCGVGDAFELAPYTLTRSSISDPASLQLAALPEPSDFPDDARGACAQPACTTRECILTLAQRSSSQPRRRRRR
jgi:hypothetical protein